MEKVITVNLNGNAYQFEEPGYALLRAYLERAELQLKDNSDKSEVIADIEQAIADKCRDCLGPHKTVVSAEDTARILNEMGPVDPPQGDAEFAHAESAGASSASEKEPAAPKKLYLIREGAMIAGVCKGFAAYFNVDVTVVRLIFVALAVVTYGAWILAYVVMMFVIPPANTSEERAAAFGLPFSAQDLIDQAKKNYAGMKNNQQWRHEWKQQRRQWKQWRKTMREQSKSWCPPMYGPANYPGQMVGYAVSGVVRSVLSVAIFVLFVLMAAGIFSPVKAGTIAGWALPAGIPLWAAILAILVLFQIIAAPLHVPRSVGVCTPGGYVVHRHVFDAFGGIVWLALIGFGAWYGYHHQPQVHAFIQSLPAAWHQIRDAVQKSKYQ